MERAREAFERIGGTGRCVGCGIGGPVVTGRILGMHDGIDHDGLALLGDVAAAAILATALGLWSDTAAAMGPDGLEVSPE